MLREMKFNRHCRKHRDDVYRFARSLLGNASDAEDATQEVLFKMWNHLDHLRRADVRSWLLRTTRNHCIDQLRKRHRAFEAWDGEAFESRPDEAMRDPACAASHADARRQIDHALESLSEKLRSVFILYEINGLRYQEVADALEIPLNSVKVYLSRARAQLKQQLTRKEPWLKV